MSLPKSLLTAVCALFFLLATAAPLPSHAQEANPISMEVEIGFDNLRKGQGWTPVQITLANSGPAIEGRIAIYTGTSNNRNTVYTAPISLPTQSNKRLFLNAHLPNTNINIIVTDEDDNVVAQLRPTNIRTVQTDGLLYGVVAPNPDSLEILSRVTAGRPAAEVALLTLSDLPSDVVAWRMLDMLVLTDVDTNELSAAQRTALRSWVELGGQLVVTGGANWQKTTSALEDLLPVEPTGLQSVDDLPALSTAVGRPFRDAGPYTVTTSNLRDGELLYRQDGLPLLARRPHGLGNVFFLALDPQFAPLEAWDGREILWDTVAQYIPKAPVWGSMFQDENAAKSAVEIFPSLTLPSATLLFCFLMLYVLAIGPLNYIILKRLNKREWAWVSVPVVVLLFSGLAYAIGAATLGNSALINQMTRVYGQMGASTGEAYTAVALYSPSRTNYNLQFPAEAEVRPLSPFGNATGGVTIERDTLLTVQSNVVDIGEVLTYAAHTAQPLPNVRGEVVVEPLENGHVKLEITLTNDSDTAFENAIILVNRFAINVGTLAPGQTITRTHTTTIRLVAQSILEMQQGLRRYEPAVSASGDSPLQTYYSDLIGPSTYGYYSYYDDTPVVFSRYQFLESLRDYYATPTSSNFPLGAVTFMGWTKAAVLDVQLDNGRANHDATTIYFLEIPFRP